MTVSIDPDLAHEVALANRILAHEGVLDAFGHVSARVAPGADDYLLAEARSPATVRDVDLLVHDAQDAAPQAGGRKLYAERVIHGAIFRARPDVMAVCHLHSPAVLPFAAAGVPIVPVFHVGATLGDRTALWDSRDEFGETDLLVATREQGESLARALGARWTVLMRRHGATVVGRSVREAVFRAVYLQQNAELQFRAQALGPLSPLTPTEIELASELNLRPAVLERAWSYWRSRLPARAAQDGDEA